MHLRSRINRWVPAILRAAALISVRRRWIAIRYVAPSVAATLLVVSTVSVGWWFYTGWRSGRIELTTEGEPVLVEVLDETSDTEIGEPFDLVTRAVLELPAGDYRLRVNGTGRLGRTFRFAVNRGETLAHKISLDEGRLLGGEQWPVAVVGGRQRVAPIRFAFVAGALELSSGKADLIELGMKSLLCRDGATRQVRWDAFAPAKPFEANRNPARWMPGLVGWLRGQKLVDPAPDLDGDGVGDLLWYCDGPAALLALSGKDGSMLWNYVAEPDDPGGPRKSGQELSARLRSSSFLAGKPAMTDVDHDGTLDCVATFVFSKSEEESRELGPKRGPYKRTIVGVSGRTGRSLWTHSFDRDFFEPSDPLRIDPAVLVQGRQSAMLAFLNITKWIGLDPANGLVKAGPLELNFMPERPIRHVDLDGDGEPEILTMEPDPGTRKETLRAVSTKTGRDLWAQRVDVPDNESQYALPFPDWPLIAELDDGAAPGVLVPDAGAMPPLSGYRGVRLLDGRTGATRWRRPLRLDTDDDGPSQVVVAPDVDGDGTRDVVTVSYVANEESPTGKETRPNLPDRFYVDMLSGKDGHPLWWWKVDLPAETTARIWKPLWWGRGPDGWPLLAVPLGGAFDLERPTFGHLIESDKPPIVHLLEASTGKERHTINGLAEASLADLDGDGLADLWGDAGGEVRAFRGEAPEAWRALGEFKPAAAPDQEPGVAAGSVVDFDGDGIGDALSASRESGTDEADDASSAYTAVARSGRDGRAIWKTALDPWENWLEPDARCSYDLSAFPLPRGDFDGDGTPDVVVTKGIDVEGGQRARIVSKLPIEVLSGRTGGRLWSAGPMPRGSGAQQYAEASVIEVRADGSSGGSDLFVHFSRSYATPASVASAASATSEEGLARISGRDGQVRWEVELPDAVEPASGNSAAPSRSGDREGDSILYVKPLVGPGATVYAVAPGDGKLLWSRSIASVDSSLHDVKFGDLDGDGRRDAVVTFNSQKGDDVGLETRAFDGRDGKARWNWNAGTRKRARWETQRVVLARLDGDGTANVCASFGTKDGKVRVVILDGRGKERVGCEVTGRDSSTLSAIDVNGDGRDELVTWYDGRLHALDRDLKEVWSWTTKSQTIDGTLPGASGRPSEVVLAPGLAFDGAIWQPWWTGQSPFASSTQPFAPKLLDRGDGKRLPLLIANGLGATVCRVAMPTDSQGRILAPRGRLAQPRRINDDPRWVRPLPWLSRLKGPLGPWGLAAASVLALVNVIVPVLILRLARGRRRYWSIRALMALPVAAAVPLMVFLTLVPRLPLGASPLLATEMRMFVTGTLAGLPILLCLVWLASSLVRVRWRPVLALLGLIVVTTVVVAGGWLWFDRRSMAAIEHYGREGWELVLLPGVYAAAVLWVLARGLRGAYRFVRHRPASQNVQ
jgi:hypothetical protein